MDDKTSTTTRNKILESAKLVFIEKGKDGARMQEIANRAGVNKAMLFYYFSNKDLLYLDVLNSIFRQLFEKINGIAISEIEPRRKIEQIVYEYTNFLSRNEGLPRIMLREIADGAEVVSGILQEIFSKSESGPFLNILSMIEDSVTSEQFRNVDPVQTFISILGMCVMYFIAKPIFKNVDAFELINQDDFLQQRQRSIIDLLENGLLKK